jgi:hypothetical protein
VKIGIAPVYLKQSCEYAFVYQFSFTFPDVLLQLWLLHPLLLRRLKANFIFSPYNAMRQLFIHVSLNIHFVQPFLILYEEGSEKLNWTNSWFRKGSLTSLEWPLNFYLHIAAILVIQIA